MGFTPGPWERGLNARERTPEDAANARLISAAPEMYAALTALLREYDAHDGDSLDWEAALELARVALAKADGQ